MLNCESVGDCVHFSSFIAMLSILRAALRVALLEFRTRHATCSWRICSSHSDAMRSLDLRLSAGERDFGEAIARLGGEGVISDSFRGEGCAWSVCTLRGEVSYVLHPSESFCMISGSVCSASVSKLAPESVAVASGRGSLLICAAARLGIEAARLLLRLNAAHDGLAVRWFA